MSTVNRFQINGVIDTSENVLDNINTLANSAGCFITWDNIDGVWSVIPNTTASSVKSFDDSNIIGSINVSGSGINELFNAVSISYPNSDLRDSVDTITLSIPSADRFPQEVDNTLNMNLQTVSDPVQAQYIASVELKQNRVDKIINFVADFTANNLKAGDLIDVSNVPYQYVGKDFRIVQIEEVDGDDGTLLFNITALEYDAGVYSTVDLEREIRSKRTGVVPKINNEAIQESDDIDAGKQIGRLLLANAASALFNSLFETDELTGEIKNVLTPREGFIPELAKRNVTIDGPTTVNEGETITLNLTSPSDCCSDEDYNVDYEISGTNITQDDVDVPLKGAVVISGGTGSIDITADKSNVTEGDETFTFKVGCTTHDVTISDTYLDAPVYVLNVNKTTADECDLLTYTLTATNHDNADDIPYVITGIQASDISSGSLSGNFTADWADGATGTVEIQLTVDGDSGTETAIMTVDGGVASVSTSITDGATHSASALPSSIVEGSTSTVTYTTTNVADAVNVPYSITGSGTADITSPALSGTVTISSGTASLSIQTSDNSDDEADRTATVTFGPIPGFASCGTVSTQIIIQDNDATPAGEIDPNNPQVDYDCDYVQVPLAWCGTFDGNRRYLKSMAVKKYCYLPRAVTGGTAVPTAVTVTNPGTPSAAISITTTVNIDATGSAGGIDMSIITAFNTPPNSGNTLLTGSTVETLRGYINL